MTPPVRKPDFIIVGAPRCATTSMFGYLQQHPRIFMPLRKEVHFFGSDLIKRSRNHWHVLDEAKYRALFAPARPDQTAGEVSVMYLYSKTAADEIKAYNADTRIIIMLRNPIDMMYSHHGQLVLAMNEDLEDFEEALAAEPDRRRGERVPRGAIIPQALYYRDTARYAEQVQRYFDAFGRANVHIVIYDDLRADVAGVFRKVLEFIGVDDDFTPAFDAANRHRRVRSRVLQRMIMKPPPVARELLHALPDRVWYGGLISIAARNSVPAARPPMPETLRAGLREEFEPEVERLSGLLGLDLMHWVR